MKKEYKVLLLIVLLIPIIIIAISNNNYNNINVSGGILQEGVIPGYTEE